MQFIFLCSSRKTKPKDVLQFIFLRSLDYPKSKDFLQLILMIFYFEYPLKTWGNPFFATYPFMWFLSIILYILYYVILYYIIPWKHEQIWSLFFTLIISFKTLANLVICFDTSSIKSILIYLGAVYKIASPITSQITKFCFSSQNQYTLSPYFSKNVISQVLY